MFRKFFLPYFIFYFYKVWSSTWRLSTVEPPELSEAQKNKQRVVFSIWHGDEMALLPFARKYHVATMTSTSRDGELMDTVLRLFGFLTSRGSSTRGGERALVGLLRLSKAGRNPVVAVDGPKGPYHKVKPGVIDISRRLQAPIFPAGVAASTSYVFTKAWNKSYLPLPFSKVVLYWGPPIPPPAIDCNSRDTNLALALEIAMQSSAQSAAKLVARS